MNKPFILSTAIARRPLVYEPQPHHYCPELQVTVLSVSIGSVPVARLTDFAGVRTKKMDIEKGDDLKERNTPRPKPK